MVYTIRNHNSETVVCDDSGTYKQLRSKQETLLCQNTGTKLTARLCHEENIIIIIIKTNIIIKIKMVDNTKIVR